jgi:hypothetical protein
MWTDGILIAIKTKAKWQIDILESYVNESSYCLLLEKYQEN